MLLEKKILALREELEEREAALQVNSLSLLTISFPRKSITNQWTELSLSLHWPTPYLNMFDSRLKDEGTVVGRFGVTCSGRRTAESGAGC